MLSVWSANVDEIDLGVVEERVIGSKGLLELVLFRVGGGRAGVSGCEYVAFHCGVGIGGVNH